MTKRENGIYILSSCSDEKLQKEILGAYKTGGIKSACAFFCHVYAYCPRGKSATRSERLAFKKAIKAYFDSIGLDGNFAAYYFIKLKRIP